MAKRVDPASIGILLIDVQPFEQEAVFLFKLLRCFFDRIMLGFGGQDPFFARNISPAHGPPAKRKVI